MRLRSQVAASQPNPFYIILFNENTQDTPLSTLFGLADILLTDASGAIGVASDLFPIAI